MLSYDIRSFKLGNIPITVRKNNSNRVISISCLCCNIKTEKNEHTLELYTSGYINCYTIDEARQYILKIKQDYKMYQELVKKLNLQTDFC